MKRTPEEQRIYEALSTIQTPPANLEEEVRARLAQKHRPARPYFRAALAAACLAVMLGVTVGAAGLSDAWRYFFPSVPENAVTDLGISQTHGDYTLTLEQAIADDSGVLLLLGLSRTDGGEMDSNIQLGAGSPAMAPGLLLDGEAVNCGGGVLERTLSGDSKTAYFVYEATGSHTSLTGKTVTFTVPALSDGVKSKQTTVSLSVLKDVEVSAWNGENLQEQGELLSQQDCRIALPEIDAFSGGALRGVLETDKGLVLAIESGEQLNKDAYYLGARSSTLVDTRTGTRYDFKGFTSAQLSDGTHVMLHSYQNCPLTAADLPWLELEVCYTIRHLATQEPFTLDFQVDTSSALTLPLEPIQFNGQTLLLRELHLSAREIALELDRSEAYDASLRVPLTITLKDGTVLEPWARGGHMNEFCVLSYTLLTEDEVPWFLDTSQVASVTIGETVFSIP